MDIFKDAWLPTDKGLLTPAAALKHATNTNWSRGDWNAATTLFLLAQLQTSVVLGGWCKDREEWADLLEKAPDDLQEKLNIFGDGTNAWQCPTAQKIVPISALIPEAPQENTLKKSADITYWKESVPQDMSVHEAQIAIMSSQLWGLPGGAGHRSGCRGQYPLTVMVEPDEIGASLWKRIFLNVLPADEWAVSTKSEKSEGKFELPWKKTKTKDKTTPVNANSLEMLWQMPRRWRMGEVVDGRVKSMFLEGKGIDYEGWNHHPLTAYRSKLKDGKPQITTVKTSSAIGFDDWASLSIGSDKSVRIPSVVNAYIEDAENMFSGIPLRLRCFGWSSGDFGHAAWIESVVPFYVKADASCIEERISQAVKSKELLRQCLGLIKPVLKDEAIRLFPMLQEEFFKSIRNNDWTNWKLTLRNSTKKIFWRIMNENAYSYDRIFSNLTPANMKLFKMVI